MNHGIKTHAIVESIDRYNKRIKIFDPNLDYIIFEKMKLSTLSEKHEIDDKIDSFFYEIEDNEINNFILEVKKNNKYGTYYNVYFPNDCLETFNLIKENDLIFIKMGLLNDNENLFEMHGIEIFNINNKKEWMHRFVLSWKHFNIDIRK